MTENSLICSLFTNSLADDINPGAWTAWRDKDNGGSITYKSFNGKDYAGNDVSYAGANFVKALFYSTYNRYLGGRDFTISFWCWINSSISTVDSNILDSNGTGIHIHCYKKDSTTTNFTMYTAKGSFNFNTSFKVWHHMVYVYNHNQQMIYFYLDGKLLKTRAATAISNKLSRISFSCMYFGRLREKEDNNFYYFNGYLKDFQIYDGVAKFNGEEEINIYDKDMTSDISYYNVWNNDYNTIVSNYTTYIKINDDNKTSFSLARNGTLVEKDTSSISTFNPYKHNYFSNSIYYDGKSGSYFEMPINLLQNYFELSFWAKPTTTTADGIFKTMICLRSVHPEKIGPSDTYYPVICLKTAYDYNGQKSILSVANYTHLEPDGGYYNITAYNDSRAYYLNHGNTDWNNYAIIYMRGGSTIDFYINGILKESIKLTYTYALFYLCFGFRDITDNETKFIGYMRDFSLKIGTYPNIEYIKTSNNTGTYIMPEIYAETMLKDDEIKDATGDLILTNPSSDDLLIKNNKSFMGTTIECIETNTAVFGYTDNQMYNNNRYRISYYYYADDTIYDNINNIPSLDDLTKAFRIYGGDYPLYTKNPIELFRRNFTIQCWFKKENSGSTIIPFAFTQVHPLQIPNPSYSYQWCNNIYIEITNNKINIKNLIYYNDSTPSIYSGKISITYLNESDKEVTESGFSTSYSINDEETLYSINNLWNHLAMVYVSKTKTFYFYLNGKKIFSSKTTIIPIYAYYICIGGGNSEYFYLNNLKAENNIARCTADTWTGYYEEPENTKFTNSYFSFKSNTNDESIDKTGSWLKKGTPTIKTGLVFDSFNNIMHPQLNFTKAVYLDGSSGLYTRNPIRLFEKDFTISGWFKTTANPGTNSYKNLIKLTCFSPSFVPEDRYGESDDICLSLWAQNGYGYKEDKAGTLYSYSEYYIGIVNDFDKVETERNYKYINSSDMSEVTCTTREPSLQYLSPIGCGDNDTVYTEMNNMNPLLLHWCHFALVYKKNERKLYFYYNGKLHSTKSNIGKIEYNYYIMLGLGYADSNNTGCFTGYIKDFEIDYGNAKYTEDTIPEIYADPINLSVYNLPNVELGFWTSKEDGYTDYFLFEDPKYIDGKFSLYGSLCNSKKEECMNLNFYNLYNNSPISKSVSYLNGYYDNMYLLKNSNNIPSESIYFDGNTGLISKEMIKLFKSNFTLHMFFNYRGPKNPDTKKYLFRILSVDPKKGYNPDGKVCSIDAYILNDKLYFTNRNGLGYSLNPTGLDNFTKIYGNYTCSVSTSSKSLYNGKSVSDFYSEYTICDYWCNITLTYDSTKKIFYCYFNGKQIGTMSVSTDFEIFMYYIYIGCGDYNNKDVNWIGYISQIYMNIGAAKCTAETFSQYYYGTYFPLNNLTTTIPFKDYSKAVTSIDDQKLGIFAAAGALTNKSITAPTFDDSREITTNAYFNGKAGLYTVSPINLGYKGFTIDFWFLSKSTKTSGAEILLALLPYPPTGQMNTSDAWIKEYTDDWSINLIPVFVVCYNFTDEMLEFGTNWFTKIVRDTTNSKYLYYSYYTIYNGEKDTYTYKSKSLGSLRAGQYAGEATSQLDWYSMSVDLLKTKWNHIAISVDNNDNLFFYVNGTCNRKVTNNYIPMSTYMQYLQIGFDNTLNNNYKWIGYITDFKISSPDTTSEDFFPGIQEAPIISSFKSSLYLTNTSNVLSNSSNGGITWTSKGRLIVDSGLTNIKTFNISKHKPFLEGTYFDSDGLIFTNKQLKIFDKDFTTSFWAKFNADNTIANSSRFLLRISGAPPSYDVSGTALPSLILYYNKSSAIISFELYTATTNTTKTVSGIYTYFNNTTSAKLLEEKWYHFAICYTKENNKLYLYINGELVYTAVPSLDLSQYTYYVYLGGAYKHNFASGWVGYIRNFEIVSQTNIAAYYTADKIPSIWAPPTLSNFKANLPFTSNLNDSYNNTWETKATPPAVINIEDAIYGFNSKKHGRFTKALYLNGNMGMYTYNSVELFNKDFTISLWVNLDKIIVTTKYLLQILPVSPVDSASGITMPGFNIYYNNNYIRFAHFTFTSRSQSSNGGYSTKFEISKYLPEIKLQFHHFAISYTANNKKFYFYIDGKLVGTNVSTVDLTYFVYYFYIGLYYNTANMYDWQGYIRNLEIDATTAKYTEDTISGIYAEPDVVVNTPIKVRRIIAALRSRIFNTKMRYAINAPILYKISIRTVIQKPIVKQDLKRFIRALRIANQSLIRRVAHRQKYQFNKTKRLLSKYLEFKFDAYRISERTRKAIAISVKSLQ